MTGKSSVTGLTPPMTFRIVGLWTKRVDKSSEQTFGFRYSRRGLGPYVGEPHLAEIRSAGMNVLRRYRQALLVFVTPASSRWYRETPYLIASGRRRETFIVYPFQLSRKLRPRLPQPKANAEVRRTTLIAHSFSRIACSRKCSGQSTLEPFRSTDFNSLAATRSIEDSYFHSVSTAFNKP
jgi:hypothetical protein